MVSLVKILSFWIVKNPTFEEYISKDNTLSILNTDSVRNGITKTIKENSSDSLEKNKLKIVILLFNDIKHPRREICDLIFHLSLLKSSFKIKGDISYLLDPLEQRERLVYCLNIPNKILTKEQIKIFKNISEELSFQDKWKLDNGLLTLEQISAILKFIYFKKYGDSASYSEELIKSITGLSKQRYTKEYKFVISKVK